MFYSATAGLIAAASIIISFFVSDSSETPRALVEIGEPTINAPNDILEYLKEIK
jgi:hypothetical protein